MQNVFFLGAMQYTLKDENVKKCIRMRKTLIKIVNWRGKMSVFLLQIAFYSFAVAVAINAICDHNND